MNSFAARTRTGRACSPRQYPGGCGEEWCPRCGPAYFDAAADQVQSNDDVEEDEMESTNTVTPPACFSTTVEHTLAAARTLSPLDRTRLVAHLIGELPGARGKSITFGIDGAAFAFLSLLPGARLHTIIRADGDGYARDGVNVDMFGVILTAHNEARALTDAERAQLAEMEPTTQAPSRVVERAA